MSVPCVTWETRAGRSLLNCVVIKCVIIGSILEFCGFQFPNLKWPDAGCYIPLFLLGFIQLSGLYSVRGEIFLLAFKNTFHFQLCQVAVTTPLKWVHLINWAFSQLLWKLKLLAFRLPFPNNEELPSHHQVWPSLKTCGCHWMQFWQGLDRPA